MKRANVNGVRIQKQNMRSYALVFPFLCVVMNALYEPYMPGFSKAFPAVMGVWLGVLSMLGVLGSAVSTLLQTVRTNN